MSDSKHRKRRKRSAGSSKTSKAPQAPLLFSNFGKKPLGLFNLMLLVNFGGCPVLFFLLDCFFFFSLSHNSRSVDQESWNFPLSLSLNSRNSLQGWLVVFWFNLISWYWGLMSVFYWKLFYSFTNFWCIFHADLVEAGYSKDHKFSISTCSTTGAVCCEISFIEFCYSRVLLFLFLSDFFHSFSMAKRKGKNSILVSCETWHIFSVILILIL